MTMLLARHYLELAPVPSAPLASKKAKDFTCTIARIHEDIRNKFEESNEKYQALQMLIVT